MLGLLDVHQDSVLPLAVMSLFHSWSILCVQVELAIDVTLNS